MHYHCHFTHHHVRIAKPLASLGVLAVPPYSPFVLYSYHTSTISLLHSELDQMLPFRLEAYHTQPSPAQSPRPSAYCSKHSLCFSWSFGLKPPFTTELAHSLIDDDQSCLQQKRRVTCPKMQTILHNIILSIFV